MQLADDRPESAGQQERQPESAAHNALEVVLRIGAHTMSALASRLTGAPLDDQLRACL
jgi:hypothetical protein